MIRIRNVGQEAGALSLTVDEDSSNTVTTKNPNPRTSRVPSHSFVSDRVLDASVEQVGTVGSSTPDGESKKLGSTIGAEVAVPWIGYMPLWLWVRRASVIV